MTVTEAYQILELSPGAEMGEIKKKYRHLMHRMHPDVYFSSGEQPSHPAQELNLAYAVLKKELAGKTHFAACPERNISFPFMDDNHRRKMNAGSEKRRNHVHSRQVYSLRKSGSKK